MPTKPKSWDELGRFRFPDPRRAVILRDLAEERVVSLETVTDYSLKARAVRSSADIEPEETLLKDLNNILTTLRRLPDDTRFLLTGDRSLGSRTFPGDIEKTLKALRDSTVQFMAGCRPGPGRPSEYDRWASLMHLLDIYNAKGITRREVAIAALEAHLQTDDVGDRTRNLLRWWEANKPDKGG